MQNRIAGVDMKVRMFVAGLSALMIMGGTAWAAPFSTLYTFGDSLSDAGDSPFAVMSLNKTLGGYAIRFILVLPMMEGAFQMDRLRRNGWR